MSEDIHKWSDGRYTLMFDEHTFFVFDNEEGKRMTALKVTKKLNEQQDTIGEQKIAIDELITDYKKLEKENEQLQKDVENLQEVVAELGATLLMHGFEIEINDENLSEMIDNG